MYGKHLKGFNLPLSLFHRNISNFPNSTWEIVPIQVNPKSQLADRQCNEPYLGGPYPLCDQWEFPFLSLNKKVTGWIIKSPIPLISVGPNFPRLLTTHSPRVGQEYPPFFNYSLWGPQYKYV